MRKMRADRDFRPRWFGPVAVCALVACAMGCTPLTPPSVKPLLRQPRMSSDSVVLDVFLVRVPFGDPEINGPAWQEIDEQSFAADARRLLLANGFRVGVLAGELPPAMAARLELGDQHKLPGEISQCKIDDLAEGASLLRGHFQLRNGARKEFSIGSTHDKLNVLLRNAAGEVSGMPYDEAQLLLAATSHLLDDGRVRLELVPEITYGRYRQGWAADAQGVFRMNPGRKTQPFDDMKFEAVLSPGNMLVLSTVPSQPGSLGALFFTEPSGEQVLLLLRLSQTQHDGAFEPQGEQPAEAASEP
jgi:hypothetical protein